MAVPKPPSWEEKFEKKMKNLEKRMEEIGQRVEERGGEYGKKIEEKAKTMHKNLKHKGHHSHGLFWGIVLIAVGILWLGNNLDWFFYDVPWFPVALIAGGLFLILKNWDKKKTTENDSPGEQE